MGRSACPVQRNRILASNQIRTIALQHTGTFFCDSTTAQFFPRTPTEVMFAAVMALKAYSS